jgi:hypothetical protein
VVHPIDRHEPVRIRPSLSREPSTDGNGASLNV